MFDTLPAPPAGGQPPQKNVPAGLTLVPYQAYNEQGKRVWYCKWARLERGESIAQAARCLSVPPEEPVWTPALKAQVQQLLQALGLRQLSSSSSSAGTCKKES